MCSTSRFDFDVPLMSVSQPCDAVLLSSTAVSVHSMTALSEAVSARENATAEIIKASMCKACPGDIFYGGRPKRAASGRLVCEFSPVAFGYLAPTLFASVSETQQSNPYVNLDKQEYAPDWLPPRLPPRRAALGSAAFCGADRTIRAHLRLIRAHC